MNAGGSVASLEWVWRMNEPPMHNLRPGFAMVSHFETMSAKEDKDKLDCRGNLLDCSVFGMNMGLQYGLSGSPVLYAVTLQSLL